MPRRQPLTDTATRYGPLTRVWHWASAALIAAALPLGLWARWMAEELQTAQGAALSDLVATTASAFSWHKTLGLSVLILALLHLLIRGSRARRPDLIRGDRPVEAVVARSVQAVLGAAVILVPLTGWLIHSASEGFAPHLLPLPQRLPAPQGPDAVAFFTALHRAAIVTLTLALVLHVAGGLRHHFRDRDATLMRMVRGRPAQGSSEQPRPTGPRLAAAGLWIAALALGAAIGAAPHPRPPQDRILPEGNWRVSEGDIRLTVTQFGREVTGRLPDWEAQITWDDQAGLGPAGHTTVRIDLRTLTLGALTAQALGPDFLDVADHPQAVFDATLTRVTDGQRAEGTLTLRGETRPVSFPFRLSTDHGTAYAGATLTLDRRDFGIGDNLPDPDVLGHEVEVRITLEASRAE